MIDRQKEPRVRDPKYLKWLHTKLCCVCGSDKVDAAHIRTGSLAYNKPHTGLGEKPSDKWSLPLCRSCHAKQHGMNELEFWRLNGIDPFALAIKYFDRAVMDGHSSPTERKPGRPRKIISGQKISSRPFGPSRGFGK